MKKLLKYLSLVCISTQAFAEIPQESSKDEAYDEILAWTKKPATQPSSKPQQQAKPTDPNPMARYGTKDDSNVFITGEAIWFKPLTNQITKQIDSTVGSTNVTKYKFYNSNFQTGYRVALGYNMPYDGWDAVAVFTGLNYKHNNSYAYNVNPDNSFGSIAYGFYYNQGDLDFGRMSKVSKRLKLRPHVGIRGLWLTQFTTTKYVDTGVNYKYRAKLDGTLIGAEMGLDSIWMLSKEYAIYANLGVPTLVNSQKVTAKTTNLNTNVVDAYSKSNYGSKIVVGLDFAIGFRWDKNLSQDRYHIGINLGYEHHSLINIVSRADSEIISRTTGIGKDQDFTYQGIALGGRLDF